MRAVVLGAAAGGGFPQWNSAGPGCTRVRAGDPAAKPRTQASLAVSADGRTWVLLNAAPDLRQQIEETRLLQPTGGLRGSPVAAVVLTGGDVDAIAGLLMLRERHGSDAVATARVHAVLDANPVFEVLARDIVARQRVPLDVPTPGCRCPAVRRSAERHAVRRARQGAALPGASRGSAPPRLEDGTDRRRRRPTALDAVLHPRLRRHDARRWPTGCAARTWCSSTARCGPTTR